MQRGWSVLFGVVLLGALLLTVLSPAFGWWLPPLGNKESFGREIDNLFYVILYVTGFFFVMTEAILVVAMWRYAERPGRRSVYVHGNHKLEMVWTLVPAGILLFIAFVQINAWADIKYATRMKPPQQIIEVRANQFEWNMRYPDKKTLEKLAAPSEEGEWKAKASADKWGNDHLADFGDLHVKSELHTWKGANTRIYLKTRDVLHSFYLPHMRLKQDAVPGKTIPVWFKPDESNGEWKNGKWEYDTDDNGKPKYWELACAELCGWGHYKMHGKLCVHKDRASYLRWLADTTKKNRTHQRDDK